MGNSYEFFLGSPWSKSKFQLTSGFAKSLRFSTGRAQLQCSQGYCSSMRGCRWRRSPLGKQWRTWVFHWTPELQRNVAQKASKKGHLIDEHPRRIEKTDQNRSTSNKITGYILISSQAGHCQKTSLQDICRNGFKAGHVGAPWWYAELVLSFVLGKTWNTTPKSMNIP